jgi:hypothetical protein
MLRPRFFCANAFSRTGYTFASPFAIAAGDMTKYFGAGAKVRQLESTSIESQGQVFDPSDNILGNRSF